MGSVNILCIKLQPKTKVTLLTLVTQVTQVTQVTPFTQATLVTIATLVTQVTLAADLLQYWVSIKRGFPFGTTTILKCTGVQNDCTHLTKNRNRRSGCRYHNWPFF